MADDDLIERAARVLSENWHNMHTNEALGFERMLARSLEAASLLRGGECDGVADLRRHE